MPVRGRGGSTPTGSMLPDSACTRLTAVLKVVAALGIDGGEPSFVLPIGRQETNWGGRRSRQCAQASPDPQPGWRTG